MKVSELFESNPSLQESAIENELKKKVAELKQNAMNKGIVRTDALDLSGIEDKYHDIVVHGIVHGTNTKRWKDYFKKS